MVSDRRLLKAVCHPERHLSASANKGPFYGPENKVRNSQGNPCDVSRSGRRRTNLLDRLYHKEPELLRRICLTAARSRGVVRKANGIKKQKRCPLKPGEWAEPHNNYRRQKPNQQFTLENFTTRDALLGTSEVCVVVLCL